MDARPWEASRPACCSAEAGLRPTEAGAGIIAPFAAEMSESSASFSCVTTVARWEKRLDPHAELAMIFYPKALIDANAHNMMSATMTSSLVQAPLVSTRTA